MEIIIFPNVVPWKKPFLKSRPVSRYAKGVIPRKAQPIELTEYLKYSQSKATARGSSLSDPFLPQIFKDKIKRTSCFYICICVFCTFLTSTCFRFLFACNMLWFRRDGRCGLRGIRLWSGVLAISVAISYGFVLAVDIYNLQSVICFVC